MLTKNERTGDYLVEFKLSYSEREYMKEELHSIIGESSFRILEIYGEGKGSEGKKSLDSIQTKEVTTLGSRILYLNKILKELIEEP